MKEIETVIEYADQRGAFITTNEGRWIRRIRQLQEKYPDEVCLIAVPETNQGILLAKVPVKWVKIAPMKKYTLTDEERQKRSENLRKIIRNAKN